MLRRIIDFHTHIFPAYVEEKAVKHLAEHYSIKIDNRALIEDLLASAAEAGIEKLVVHGTAVHPSKVVSINNWIASVSSDKIISFGNLHPDQADYKDELKRMKDLGIKGIKFHPDFQAFYIDDPKMWPIYEAIGSNFPILFHVGDEKLDYSSPKRLRKVLHDFPELTVIAAHLGGYSRWDEAQEYLVGEEVYLDTSSCFWKLSPQQANYIIRSHGADRIVFGSDYPVTSPKEELERFMRLPLSKDEQEKILWQNASHILGLEK